MVQCNNYASPRIWITTLEEQDVITSSGNENPYSTDGYDPNLFEGYFVGGGVK